MEYDMVNPKFYRNDLENDKRREKIEKELKTLQLEFIVLSPTQGGKCFEYTTRNNLFSSPVIVHVSRVTPCISFLKPEDIILGKVLPYFNSKYKLWEFSIESADLLPWGGLWFELVTDLISANAFDKPVADKILDSIENIKLDVSLLRGWIPENHEVQPIRFLEWLNYPKYPTEQLKERHRQNIKRTANNGGDRIKQLCSIGSAYIEFLNGRTIFNEDSAIENRGTRGRFRNKDRSTQRSVPSSSNFEKGKIPPVKRVEPVVPKPSPLTTIHISVKSTKSKEDKVLGMVSGFAWIGIEPDLTILPKSPKGVENQEVFMEAISKLSKLKNSKCIPFAMPFSDINDEDAAQTTLALLTGGLLPQDAPHSLNVIADKNILPAFATPVHFKGLLAGWKSSDSDRYSRWKISDPNTAISDHQITSIATVFAQAALSSEKPLGESIPLFMPLNSEIIRNATILSSLASGNYFGLLQTATDAWGTPLWEPLIEISKKSIGTSDHFRISFLETLEKLYENKARDLRKLGAMLSFVHSVIPKPEDESHPRIKLLWSLLDIQDANHRGDPDSAKEEVKQYISFRPKAIDLDRELSAYADLNLAVHFADQFEFAEAKKTIETLIEDPHFDGLSSLMRGGALSSLGQYFSMQGQFPIAKDYFTQAIELFLSASLSNKEREREIDQTGVYRAINALDAGFDNGPDLLREIIGALDLSAETMAKSADSNKVYHHHLFLRALYSQSSIDPVAEGIYLKMEPQWKFGLHHPWPLIGMYRALILWRTSKELEELAEKWFVEAIDAATTPPLGATMSLIGAVIATAAVCHFDAEDFSIKAGQLLEDASLRLPAAASSVEIIRDVLDNPGPDRMEYLLSALPFNYK